MASAPQPSAGPVSESDVRTELGRLLGSPHLEGSERLSALLTYSVERGLARDLNSLKESVIAVEVFGRETAFDTAANSVVRNAARRLRQKLNDYYSSDGAADPVRIEIPKGGYVPEFVAVPAPLSEPMPAGKSIRRAYIGWLAAAVAALIALAAIPPLLENEGRGQTSRLVAENPTEQQPIGAALHLGNDPIGQLRSHQR
jgi:hypothetical protein